MTIHAELQRVMLAISLAEDARRICRSSAAAPVPLSYVDNGSLGAICTNAPFPHTLERQHDPVASRETVTRFESAVQWIHDRIDCLPSRLQPPVSCSQIASWLDANAGLLRSRLEELRGHAELTAWWRTTVAISDGAAHVGDKRTTGSASGAHYLRQRRAAMCGDEPTDEQAVELQRTLSKDLGKRCRRIIVQRRVVGDRDTIKSPSLQFPMLSAHVLVLRSEAQRVRHQLECTLVQNERSVVVRGPLPLYFFLDSSGLM